MQDGTLGLRQLSNVIIIQKLMGFHKSAYGKKQDMENVEAD